MKKHQSHSMIGLRIGALVLMLMPAAHAETWKEMTARHRELISQKQQIDQQAADAIHQWGLENFGPISLEKIRRKLPVGSMSYNASGGQVEIVAYKQVTSELVRIEAVQRSRGNMSASRPAYVRETQLYGWLDLTKFRYTISVGSKSESLGWAFGDGKEIQFSNSIKEYNGLFVGDLPLVKNLFQFGYLKKGRSGDREEDWEFLESLKVTDSNEGLGFDRGLTGRQKAVAVDSLKSYLTSLKDQKKVSGFTNASGNYENTKWRLENFWEQNGLLVLRWSSDGQTQTPPRKDEYCTSWVHLDKFAGRVVTQSGSSPRVEVRAGTLPYAENSVIKEFLFNHKRRHFVTECRVFDELISGRSGNLPEDYTQPAYERLNTVAFYPEDKTP